MMNYFRILLVIVILGVVEMSSSSVPMIVGRRTSKVGEVIEIECHVHDSSQFMIYESDSEKCNPKRTLRNFTTIKNSTTLILRMKPSWKFSGTIRFYCGSKTTDHLYGVCHGVLIGDNPIRPTSVKCADYDGETFVCKIHPSPKELMKLDKSITKISYRVLVRRVGADVVYKCCVRNCQCVIKDDTLTYYKDSPFCIRFRVQVNTTSLYNTTVSEYISPPCQKIHLFAGLKWYQNLSSTHSLTFGVVSKFKALDRRKKLKLICESNYPIKQIREQLYTIQKAYEIRTIDGLKPGVMYYCYGEAKLEKDASKTDADNYIEFSDQFRRISATTLSMRPSGSPVVYAGMVRRIKGKWYFYFLPILPSYRNGKIDLYRMSIGKKIYRSTRSCIMVSNISDIERINRISFSGSNVAGSSDNRTVVFNSTLMGQTKVELELWKKDGYYFVKPRIDRRSFPIKELSLLICQCGSQCHIPICDGLYGRPYNNSAIKMDLMTERIALHVTSHSPSRSSMSDWIGCAYENVSNPFNKKFRIHPDVKSGIEKGDTNYRYFIMDKVAFECSETMKQPVYTIYKRWKCDNRSSPVEKVKRKTGADYFNISTELNFTLKKLNCAFELSFDGKVFNQVLHQVAEVEGPNILKISIGVLVPAACIIVLIIVSIVWKYCRADCEDMWRRIRKNPQFNEPTKKLPYQSDYEEVDLMKNVSDQTNETVLHSQKIESGSCSSSNGNSNFVSSGVPNANQSQLIYIENEGNHENCENV